MAMKNMNRISILAVSLLLVLPVASIANSPDTAYFCPTQRDILMSGVPAGLELLSAGAFLVLFLDANYVLTADNPINTKLHNKILIGSLATFAGGQILTPIVMPFTFHTKQNTAWRSYPWVITGTTLTAATAYLAANDKSPIWIPVVSYVGTVFVTWKCIKQNMRWMARRRSLCNPSLTIENNLGGCTLKLTKAF